MTPGKGGDWVLEKHTGAIEAILPLTGEAIAGYDALIKALSEPFLQIVRNSGQKDAAVALNEVIQEKNVNFGYDINENKPVVDMIKAGIIDPLKVTRSALENAVSVVGMVLTTEAVVTDLPKKDEPQMPAGMGGMGGMM